MDQENTLKNNIGKSGGENSPAGSLRDNIFKKIKAGEVTMKPKYYFYSKIALLVFVIFVTLLTSAFLVSYLIFSLQVGGHFFLLGFGAKGLYEFFVLFPWLILIIDVCLLLFLDWLLKSFRFGYNSPIIYLFLGTFVVITGMGTLLTFTPFHDTLMRRAEGGRDLPPPMNGIYGGVRRSHSEQGIFRGIVVSIDKDSFIIEHNDYDMDRNNGQIRVVVPATTDITKMIKIGDEVFVAGDATNSEIHAYGFHRLPN
jgi:hypothetical protein